MNEASSRGVVGEALRLLRPFWRLALFSTLAGIASGLATAFLLGAINRALQTEGGATSAVLLSFGGLCVFTIASAIVAHIGNSTVSQDIVASVQLELCAKIVRAPIREIERMQVHRLLATLNRDVEAIAAFAFGLSGLTIALAVVVACLAYLLMLSPLFFAVTVGALALGTWAHALARNRGIAGLRAVREAHERLLGHFRALCEGAKELRINRLRRARVYGERTVPTIRSIRDAHLRAVRVFAGANAVGSLLFFIVVGVVLVLSTQSNVDRAVLGGFVVVLLYIRTPIEQLVMAMPMLGQAQVALGRIAEVSQRFSTEEAHLRLDASQPPPTAIDSIVLQDACFSYPSTDGGGGFALGPVNLTIRPGEILFITGENGCGKTTLIKLILALYEPSGGAVLLNGEALAAERRDDYRQLFSAVFFDFFLFDDLVHEGAAVPDQVRTWLERLELAHKVAIRDGAFSTVELSAGQRKRLALIQVYLENRPVIVFDEWAAEQDPTFRRIFYEEILPELRRQGKALIVISHDDRYFAVADRRIELREGRQLPSAG
ncbi:MAG: cyclic peptide export ABC transporter [Reyranellaceae bacterium]